MISEHIKGQYLPLGFYPGITHMKEWDFENWGIKYWSKTPDFVKYWQEHSEVKG